ncbi:MAG: MFS transporter [Eubacteriaceae bacterium]|nr:MFS transporter [Eubacteriaceae bacterium]
MYRLSLFLLCIWGGDEAIAGVASGLFSVSSLLMRPIVGWVLDNKSRKILLFFGLTGLVVLPVLYSAINIIAMILLLRLFHGIFWASTTTSLNTNASDIIPKERFGEGMGYFGLTATISLSIAPLLGLTVMDKFSFNVLFLSSACIIALALILAFNIKVKETKHKKHASTSIKTIFKNIINKDALPASAVMFLFLMPYGAVTTFIAVYSEQIQVGSGGLFFAVMAISTGIIRIVSGKVSDKKGEAPIVYTGVICMSVSLIMLAKLSSPLIFIVSALLFGVGFGGMAPTMQAMAMRISPPERRGSASSTYLCAFDLGMGLGGVISGYLVRWFGYSHMYKFMILALLFSFLVYFLWARKTPSAFKKAS